MKLYLSSYKLGDKTEQLKRMVPPGRSLGYIPNARDFSTADPERKTAGIAADMQELRELGIEVELVDLKEYFGHEDALRSKIAALGGVFVGGGNAFVLRQAMRLSGFDEILQSKRAENDFLYSGYSAAGCVLSPSLTAYQIVDDAADNPYGIETIFDGLNIIDYAFLPHYKSDHPESPAIDKEVAYCKEQGIPYRTLRDGEVIIRE